MDQAISWVWPSHISSTALSLEPNPSTPSRPIRLYPQSTVWAEPERSIGLEHSLVKSPSCWQAIGPAQELWANLGPQIRRLIENSEDILDEGEQKSRNLSIELYMIGRDKTCAVPTVVFSSTSRPKRRRAKDLLKKSKLLDKHPAVKICTLEKLPLMRYAGSSVSLPKRPSSGESTQSGGIVLVMEDGRTASMTLVLLVHGLWYGLTVEHLQSGSTEEELEYFAGSSHDASCFDTEDEQSASDGADFAQITSQG